MEKKAINYLYEYYDDKIKKVNVPKTDFTQLPPYHKKNNNRGFIPKIIYACIILFFTLTIIVNRGKQSMLEKHIQFLDSHYKISQLIPKRRRKSL
jgi:hypothetical protein